jgi:molecular chaperone HscA
LGLAKIKINIKEGTIQRNDKVLGIDLGTTNSLVAIVNQDNSKPYCLGSSSELITPSVIHIDKDFNVIVGEEALKYFEKDSKNTIYSIKRLLGRSYTDVVAHVNEFGYELIPDNTQSMVNVKIHEKSYNPIELSSLILKELKRKAELVLNEKVSKAVITVPAYFNDSQRQATRDAGKLAGLDVLRIVNEPTAASLAYGIGLEKEMNATIAVYDLGGGTFDVTLLQIQNGVYEVLSTNGDTYTGGDDFDKEIVGFWMENEPKLQSIVNDDKSVYQTLRLLAEKTKIQLSSTNKHIEKLIIDEDKFELSLEKEQFEELIAPIVEKTLKSCRMALKDAGLTHKDIDEVVMVGGSTRTPYVLESVKRFFRKEKVNNELNPDEVVALGAAVEADILAGNRKDILLLDVTPLSLGIETLGGLMDTIITRNSKIPCKAGRQYTTSKDGQNKLKIAVYQGERELCEDNRKLGEFILNGIPAMPAGLPKIDIQFLINADGILNIEAVELRSGVKQSIQLQPQYGLSDKDVEKMLLSAMQNAEHDMNARLLAEAKTEAEQIVYQCQKIMKGNESKMSKEEIDATQTAVQELLSLCQGTDKDAINRSVERLNHITRPFAERIMDEAIGNALKGKSLDAL